MDKIHINCDLSNNCIVF